MPEDHLVNVVVNMNGEPGIGFCKLTDLRKSKKTGLVLVSIAGLTHMAKRENVKIIPTYEVDYFLKLLKKK